MTMTNCNTSASVRTNRKISLLGFFKLAFAAHAQRRALRNLSQHALDDIGLTADQAKTEANRALWDVPAAWRC